MRAFYLTTWSNIFVTVMAFCLPVAGVVLGPFEELVGNPPTYMENGYLPGRLKEILGGTAYRAFKKSYPLATVDVVARATMKRSAGNLRAQLDPGEDHQVYKKMNELADERQFILLGSPYQGEDNKGYAAAFPFELNRGNVPETHRFAFISIDDGKPDPRSKTKPIPRVAFHGFADVQNVPELIKTLKAQKKPKGRIEVGSTLTGHELLENVDKGWSHYG